MTDTYNSNAGVNVFDMNERTNASNVFDMNTLVPDPSALQDVIQAHAAYDNPGEPIVLSGLDAGYDN